MLPVWILNVASVSSLSLDYSCGFL